MTDIYLVIKVGYEGIDSIYRGFLEPDKAVAYIKKLRDKHMNPQPEDDEWTWYSYLVEEYGEEKAKEKLSSDLPRFCIQKGSETEDFHCVCGELGVSLTDDLILY